MNDLNFGLDDLHIENADGVFGRLVLYVMLGSFALASMITTFSFFATFAPNLGAVLHPDYGGVIAGVLGVVLFDLAGLGWTVLRSRNSDTSHQFVIATAAAVFTITLALLTSALYVLLSSSFDVGLYTAEGALSSFGRGIQGAGVIVMTLGFILNFGAIAAYVNVSAATTKAVQDTQLRAFVSAGRFAADKARAELVARQTLAAIMAELPHLAEWQGQRSGAAYLGQTFAGAPTLQAADTAENRGREREREKTAVPVEASTTPETLSANGSGAGGDNERPFASGRGTR